jgi:hypothetical protein
MILALRELNTIRKILFWKLHHNLKYCMESSKPRVQPYLGFDTPFPDHPADSHGYSCQPGLHESVERLTVLEDYVKDQSVQHLQALDGETEADVGDVLLTHSATERQYNVFTAELGLADRHYNIHARNGNLADNTAPVALSQAIQVRLAAAVLDLSRKSD